MTKLFLLLVLDFPKFLTDIFDFLLGNCSWIPFYPRLSPLQRKRRFSFATIWVKILFFFLPRFASVDKYIYLYTIYSNCIVWPLDIYWFRTERSVSHSGSGNFLELRKYFFSSSRESNPGVIRLSTELRRREISRFNSQLTPMSIYIFSLFLI